MATIKLKIDERNKGAQKLIEFLKTLSFVEVEEKSPYNPEFVKKIERASKQIKKGNYVVLDSNNIWGSLGL